MVETNRRNLNPLWIISLFLSLTEAVIGIAASQGRGWVRGVWAIFSVAFPTAVGVAFFVFLWKKPFVFYAPRDFTDATPVADYVAAMGATGPSALTALQETVRSAVKAALSTVATDKEQVITSAAIEDIVASATEDFRSRAVEVDLAAINPRLAGDPLRVFIEETTPVQRLTDQVYFGISRYVKPFRYGTDWMLVDSSTGRELREMGKRWAVDRLGLPEDSRPVSEVGIHPGSRLAAVRLQET